MSMTDPIADMLTRIRNANMRGSSEVVIPSSKIKKVLQKYSRMKVLLKIGRFLLMKIRFRRSNFSWNTLMMANRWYVRLKEKVNRDWGFISNRMMLNRFWADRASPSLRHLKELCQTGSAAKKKSVEKYFVPFGKELIDWEYLRKTHVQNW